MMRIPEPPGSGPPARAGRPAGRAGRAWRREQLARAEARALRGRDLLGREGVSECTVGTRVGATVREGGGGGGGETMALSIEPTLIFRFESAPPRGVACTPARREGRGVSD